MKRARSILAVPGSNSRMIEKALASTADITFLDLEDAVAPTEKETARAQVIGALRDLNWNGKPRTIRINALDSPHCYRDLIEIVETAGEFLDLIIVPKVNSVEDVAFVSTLLGQIELRIGLNRHIGLEVQIETAHGLIQAEQIAASCSRLEAIVFGPGDYAASVGMPVNRIGVPDEWDEAYGANRWHYPMSKILVAGRAAGLRVLDGPYADIRDMEGLRRSCRVARALGYDGKWCIHPGQIDITNEVFTPTANEIAWAHQVMNAYSESISKGKGAFAIDGKMIDGASIRMAQQTLNNLQTE